MPYSFIAVASVTAAAEDLVIPKPTGTIEFDLMVAVIQGTSTVAYTLPSGWTIIGPNPTSPTRAFKIAGASEPANYTFGGGNAGIDLAAIVTYRGGKKTIPILDGSPAITSAAGSTVINYTATSAAQNGELLLATGTVNTNTTISTPTGYNLRLVLNHTVSGVSRMIAIFDKLNVASGIQPLTQSTIGVAAFTTGVQNTFLPIANNRPHMIL